jgi:hypothetical protein
MRGPMRHASDPAARIEIRMTAMVTAQDETVQLRRLVEFAADVAELANERPDLDLRVLVDGPAPRPDPLHPTRGGLTDDP